MRYIPHTEEDVREMLKASGVSSIDELFRSIPNEIKLKKPMGLPPALSEIEILREMERIGRKNRPIGQTLSFLGAGCYEHHVPAAVGEIVSRSEWLTPYTPYQPEISQGTLQAIFEYQSMICELTGMDVSNASHYDGATATAEAAIVACQKTGRKNIVAAGTLHPEYRDVIKTIFAPKSETLTEIAFTESGEIDITALKNAVNSDTAGVIVQSPNFFGIIEDLEAIGKIAHDVGALFIVTVTEPISLGILESPGKLGADIVAAEGQSLGSGMNFGGPCLGIFAAKEKLARQMPGRITGVTKDKNGKRGFVLTMSTREQHIRREKALSNICSNEALLATTAAIYMALMGKEGFKKLAGINLSNSTYLKHELAKIPGIKIQFSGPTFNEFVITLGTSANDFKKHMIAGGIYAGVSLECWWPKLTNSLLVTTTECHTKEDLDKYIETAKKGS